MFGKMIRNKSINVKLVSDRNMNAEEPSSESNGNPFEGVEVAAMYAEIVKDVVTHTALTIGGVYAACKIIGRICR